MDKLKLQAQMHGAEFKDSGNKGSENPQPDQSSIDPEVPLFGDPDDYDNMSEDERESLTQKMMGKHRTFVKQKGL